MTQNLHTTPLERYLAEQTDLSPVERFSAAHDAGFTLAPGTWQDRIPLSRPAPGQQPYRIQTGLGGLLHWRS